MKITGINLYKTYDINKTNTPLKAMPYDSVSFGALKKSAFHGLDLAAVNRFKAPIEKFNSDEDLQKWCDDKYKKDYKNKKYFARTITATKERQKTLGEWFDYAEKNHTPATALIIAESITKDLKLYNDKTPPTLNTEIADNTIKKLDNYLKENPKFDFDFKKIYEKGLRKHYLKEEIGKIKDGWIVIPSFAHDRENFDDNVEKLKALSYKTWCTRNTHARKYLEGGDFHLLMKDGKPVISMRLSDGKVTEIQGKLNNMVIPPQYTAEIARYTKESGIRLSYETQNALDNAELNLSLYKEYVTKYQNAYAEEGTQGVLKAAGIDVEKDDDGKLILSTYKEPNDVITFEDLGFDEDKFFEEIKQINDDVCFNGTCVTDLGALEEIKGDAYFVGSSVVSLGNLKHIGGRLYYDAKSKTDFSNVKVDRERIAL